MKVLIFNSGRGSRMHPMTDTQHKSMTPLKNGESILHRQLRILIAEGLKDFVITTGPFADQIEAATKDFPEAKFTFVPNDKFAETNYIYSMYLARNEINDNMIFMHGDLVFNQKLAHDMIQSAEKSLATANFKKALPEKDFKARVVDGCVHEVSINIFDDNCFAFQAFYKLEKAYALAWIKKVEEYVAKNKVKCYAENAFNEILPALKLKAFNYDGYYIDEIDNAQDWERVTEEILAFDK